MRVLRVTLAGTATLALLVSLGGGVLAQDPEKATWTHVTGIAQEEEWVGDPSDDPTHRWDGSVEFIPGSSGSYTVEWSDPRLPRTMRIQQDAALHHGDMTSYDDWMILAAITARLDDSDGAWTGSGYGVIGTDGQSWQAVLEGEGTYEGLSALLEVTWTGEDYTILEFDGWILESPLPSMPEPVEPATE